MPFDLEVIARTDAAPTKLQSRLFLAPSFEDLVRDVIAWIDAQ